MPHSRVPVAFNIEIIACTLLVVVSILSFFLESKLNPIHKVH